MKQIILKEIESTMRRMNWTQRHALYINEESYCRNDLISLKTNLERLTIDINSLLLHIDNTLTKGR